MRLEKDKEAGEKKRTKANLTTFSRDEHNKILGSFFLG